MFSESNNILLAEYIIAGTYTYKVPSDINKIGILMVAGGGGGAGDSITAGNSGNGGNGGSVKILSNITVGSNRTISITVGAGGVGGSGGNNTSTATAGDDTVVVIDGINYTVTGGYKGLCSYQGSNTSQPDGQTGGIGGKGTDTGATGKIGTDGYNNPFDLIDDNLYGASGAGGNQAYNTTSDIYDFNNHGGITGGGRGGYGINNNDTNKGSDALFYGAGGGGASFCSRHANGGNGYQGCVKIYAINNYNIISTWNSIFEKIGKTKPSSLTGNQCPNKTSILDVGSIEVSGTYMDNQCVLLKDVSGTSKHEFNYTGSVESVHLEAGQWKIEVWGASGGECNGNPGSWVIDKIGSGKGGYSTGILTLSNNTTLYICVGQRGGATSSGMSGGYNGGGSVTSRFDVDAYSSGGGGCTSVSFVSGTVKDIGSSNKSQIIIIAGGGGGCGYCNGPNWCGGGHAGDVSGLSCTDSWSECGKDIAIYPSSRIGYGGTQSAGGSGGGQSGKFGYGGNGGKDSGAGGGGGFYGGGGPDTGGGGGGGSSYLSTSLQDSSTLGGNQSFLSPTGTTETGHTGNGFCRITKV